MVLSSTASKALAEDGAARAYQESVKLRPTFVYALYNLAVAYSKKDRLPEAGELLRKVVGIEPRNVFGQHALGMLYVRTGNKTGAMRQYYILEDSTRSWRLIYSS